ncbi:olfactory receptor 14C36-like [Leptosomus discolor]
MSNASSITQFLLMVFADKRELQLSTFGLFLGIYLAALLGNVLIITAIACDPHLHTPMYFFLLNLSFLDLGSLSTTLPKAMVNSLWNTRAISYTGCAAQVFLNLFFIAAEYFLLTVMAYDRYVAICKPLHYGTLLGSRACVHMAAAAWGTAFPYALLHTANTFSLPLCQGNAVDQFFCEIPQILKLSCSDTYIREVGVIVASVCLLCVCFVFIVVSYVQIFRAVLRIPLEQGRHKAFSTCLPHLAVVSLFVSTGMFAYLKPPSISSPFLNLVMAVLYSLLPPAVNPLIYSMRNQELKDALRKLMTDCFSEAAMNCPFFSVPSLELLRQLMRAGVEGTVANLSWRLSFNYLFLCSYRYPAILFPFGMKLLPAPRFQLASSFRSSLLTGRFLVLLGGGCPSQVCVLLLAFLAPLSCLGPPYSLVTTAKADTDYSVPEQLFFVCQDQVQGSIPLGGPFPEGPKIHLGALEFLFEFQLGYDMDPYCAWRTLSWKTQVSTQPAQGAPNSSAGRSCGWKQQVVAGEGPSGFTRVLCGSDLLTAPHPPQDISEGTFQGQGRDHYKGVSVGTSVPAVLSPPRVWSMQSVEPE